MRLQRRGLHENYILALVIASIISSVGSRMFFSPIVMSFTFQVDVVFRHPLHVKQGILLHVIYRFSLAVCVFASELRISVFDCVCIVTCACVSVRQWLIVFVLLCARARVCVLVFVWG